MGRDAAGCASDAGLVTTCPICRRRYDERAYQLVVRGLGSFDTIACVDAAVRQRERAGRELVHELSDAVSAARERTRARRGPTGVDRSN